MESPGSTTVAILLLALLSGMTTLIGVALALTFGKQTRGIAFGIGFSAGIMVLVSLLELIPEAIRQSAVTTALPAVASGALLVAALHWLIPHTHLVEEKGLFNRRLIRSAYLVAFGLILHDVPEGFAMANAFIAAPAMGLMVALAIALHNIPEEFAMAAPLVAFTRRRTLVGAALLSGLAEPLGALLGLSAVHLHPGFNPLFMAFAAGAMIYISLHELLPMARLYQRRGWFSAGAAFSVALYLLMGLLLPQ
jgi:ZIP family zinc transporter